MITIGLFAVVALLTIKSSSFVDKTLVRSELHKLHNTCRYLQHLACTACTEHTISFNSSNNSYTYNDVTEKLPANITFGFLPEAKGPPSSPKKIIKKPITFTNNTIRFYKDGIIKAGTVYLVDNEQRCMYALSSPIAPFSFLRLYRYDAAWHCLS